MIIKCLFGQRKCKYEGEYGPELLIAWDEFTLEENTEGFDLECQMRQSQLKDEFSAFRVIDVSVSQEIITCYLNESPTIKGELSLAS